MRDHLSEVYWCGNTHPICEQHHFMGVVPDLRYRCVHSFNCEWEALITMETPTYWRFQSHGVHAKGGLLVWREAGPGEIVYDILWCRQQKKRDGASQALLKYWLFFVSLRCCIWNCKIWRFFQLYLDSTIPYEVFILPIFGIRMFTWCYYMLEIYNLILFYMNPH